MIRQSFIFTAFLLLALTAQANEAPRVVVSISPIHSLVSGVMDGVAEPELLLGGGRSPHSYLLKPSQMRSLQQADVVVWVGESVEGFLAKTVVSLDKEKIIIKMMDVQGMLILSSREGGTWERQHEDPHESHDHGDTDGHLWLDPTNAGRIVETMVIHLNGLDPQNAEVYRANGRRLQQQLTVLDQRLSQRLAPVRHIPYLVFHDAYQYFERHYQLNPVGALMVDAEHKPGARRLKEIRERLRQKNVRCVFSEPQFQEKFLKVITEGSDIDIATLDPMGVDIAPGKGLYFEMMASLGRSLVDCLNK